MNISQKDIKILWGRSGNRCAICKTQLTQDASTVSSTFTLGEQAHIVGEKPGSARSNSLLTPEERNSYHNLILLCPTHHTEIDCNPSDWPVDRLYLIKSQHELWVNETLSEKSSPIESAKQVTVNYIIDSAVELCSLDQWVGWTSFALSSEPSWDIIMPNKVYEFRKRVLAAIWPEEFKELKCASYTLAILLHQASQKFQEHAELNPELEKYYPVKFYKILVNNPNYIEDVKAYEQWLYECHRLVIDATKAANWFADIVRRDINPLFFAQTGKFLIERGPFKEDLSCHTRLVEFMEEEKINLLNLY